MVKQSIKKKETPYVKKPIPKALRNKVWTENCGENFKSHCFCCNKKITVQDWECGHIQAEAKGGTLTIDNLKPICTTCNRSMGTQNMEDFKKSFQHDGYSCLIC